jgi:hypothetical protein
VIGPACRIFIGCLRSSLAATAAIKTWGIAPSVGGRRSQLADLLGEHSIISGMPGWRLVCNTDPASAPHCGLFGCSSPVDLLPATSRSNRCLYFSQIARVIRRAGAVEWAQARAARYRLGVTPVSRRKMDVRWLSSMNPHCWAIIARGCMFRRIKVFARSIRRCMT